MIDLYQISKSFGRVRALDDVSLKIRRGERVALIGSNGSGKTTLLRALLGLVRVSGTATIDGLDVARDPEGALRKVAYIPQVAPPIEATVAEFVRAQAALRAVAPSAIRDSAARLGLIMGQIERVRFRDLSGGMRQKLLAAVALAADAEILICDEPTANLDAAARSAFFEQVEARAADKILILCSHRLEEVERMVGRAVELCEGRVKRDTALTSLIANLRTFRVAVTLQGRARDAEDYLRAHGFAHEGRGRYTARLTRAQKVDLLAGLLREHEQSVLDFEVVRENELSLGEAEAALYDSQPRLKGVAS